LFQPLREDRLACRLSHPAADRQVVATVLTIIQKANPFSQVVIGFVVLLPLGSSGVPGGWCWVVRRKLLFSNDLWRKTGHSVYRTQATELKRLTMNLRKQPPGT